MKTKNSFLEGLEVIVKYLLWLWRSTDRSPSWDHSSRTFKQIVTFLSSPSTSTIGFGTFLWICMCRSKKGNAGLLTYVVKDKGQYQEKVRTNFVSVVQFFDWFTLINLLFYTPTLPLSPFFLLCLYRLGSRESPIRLFLLT